MPKTQPKKGKATRRQIAEALSLILRNPGKVPTHLYNDLGDRVTELSDHVDHDSPEHIEYLIKAWEEDEDNE